MTFTTLTIAIILAAILIFVVFHYLIGKLPEEEKPLLTVNELVASGKWETFFLNEKGERIPYTPENHALWLNMDKSTMKWNNVSREIPK